MLGRPDPLGLRGQRAQPDPLDRQDLLGQLGLCVQLEAGLPYRLSSGSARRSPKRWACSSRMRCQQGPRVGGDRLPTFALDWLWPLKCYL